MFPDVTYFPSEPDVYEATSPCVWRGKACESYTLKSPTYDEEVPPLMPHSAPRDSQPALKPSFSTPYSARPSRQFVNSLSHSP